MSAGNPDLRIVPLTSIKLQEGVTDAKATALARNLTIEKQIINPIVVASLGEGCFVQLDGASRVVSLAILGAPWAFVHVVDYKEVSLTTWAHVTRMDSSALRRLDDNDPKIRLTENRQRRVDRQGIENFDLVATALFADGDYFGIYSTGGLMKRVKTANQLIGLYELNPEQRIDIDGGGIEKALDTARYLGQNGVAIEYANFSQADVMQVVASRELLPPGVTKHRLQQRVLMNYPLDRLLNSYLSQRDQNRLLAQTLAGIKFHPYRDRVIFQAEPWGNK